ncbi:hypothetical protein, partial [Methylomonas albis]
GLLRRSHRAEKTRPPGIDPAPGTIWRIGSRPVHRRSRKCHPQSAKRRQRLFDGTGGAECPSRVGQTASDWFIGKIQCFGVAANLGKGAGFRLWFGRNRQTDQAPDQL